MTNVLLCLLLVLNPIGFAQVKTPANPPFTVTISADHPTPKVGEPLLIHIVLQSTSREPVTVTQERHVGTRGEFNYRITVVHVDGSAVPDTAEGISLRNGTLVGEFSAIIRQLQFGDKIEEDADLNNLVEITAPGYYVVQAERTLGLHVGSGIKSNKLLFRVR
jgi:hypothetical protein